MSNWREKKNEPTVNKDFDIDGIDQSIFDDPVQLLNYLEKLETKKETNNPKLAKHEFETTTHPVKHQIPSSSHIAIYGYTNVHGRREIHQTEAKAVEMIFSQFDNGKNYNQIANYMSTTQYRTRNLKKIYPVFVQRIIGDREVYEGKTGYPPILHKQSGSKNEGYSSRKQNILQSNRYKVGREMKPAETKSSQTITKKSDRDKNLLEKRSRTILKLDVISYKSVDDFLKIIQDRGVLTKDNRWNDGCVWVHADPLINDLMSKVQIKGRQFRYTPKCRAFNGEPGWYY